MQRDERREPRGQQGGVGEEVGVFLLEQRHALRGRRVDADAGAGTHRVEQRAGNLDAADALAFGFDVHRARRIERIERGDQFAVEHLLRWLRAIGQVAEQRAAVAGEALEIEHLRALCRERLDEATLAGAGESADHLVAKPRGQGEELRAHVAPVGPVAAGEPRRAPADFAQDVGERTAALTAAPAVDQWCPVARLVRERAFEHRGDVARNDRGAEASRGERRFLRVHRADARPLGVVQHRMIDGARNVVLREFRGAAHVDAIDVIANRLRADLPLGARVHAGHRRRGHRVRASMGCSTFHIVSSIIGCAAGAGWIRSD